MPVYRFFTDEPLKTGQNHLIEGSEQTHLKKVLRLKEGDAISLIDGRGNIAQGRLVELKKESAKACIDSIEYQEKPFHLTLVQGILKPNKLDFLVEKATEIGADEILFFGADKGELKLLKEERLKRLTNISCSALKQSGSLHLPKIKLISSLDQLKIYQEFTFYGDFTKSALTLKKLGKTDKLMWIVGPESGFSDRELQKLTALGAKPFSLNNNTLRAETAAIAGLSLFAHHLSFMA